MHNNTFDRCVLHDTQCQWIFRVEWMYCCCVFLPWFLCCANMSWYWLIYVTHTHTPKLTERNRTGRCSILTRRTHKHSRILNGQHFVDNKTEHYTFNRQISFDRNLPFDQRQQQQRIIGSIVSFEIRVSRIYSFSLFVIILIWLVGHRLRSISLSHSPIHHMRMTKN